MTFSASASASADIDMVTSVQLMNQQETAEFMSVSTAFAVLV